MLDRFGDLEVVQTFFPFAKALERAGRCVVAEPSGEYVRTLVLLSRHRALSEGIIAKAWDATTNGGSILISGAKTDGVDAVLKSLRAADLAPDAQSRAHGRVICLRRNGPRPAMFKDWCQAAEPREIADGFLTRAGVFSADGVDPGSRLLAFALPSHLDGRAADLGAGWGYLSVEALKKGDNLTELHLIEAERTALDLARRNVRDPRAVFHWTDATDPLALPRDLDHVLMNPPFHAGRAADPALGQAFIETACELLRPGGRLWMVANRHLPYEKPLARAFADPRLLTETDGFKVIAATKPKRAARKRAVA